jgi:xylulokinase
MYIGIDIGTSSVKALLVDDDKRVVVEASAPLTVSRPQPLWSEQDPEQWWNGCCAVLDQFRSRKPDLMAAVRGLGLSGQMHGATLLGADDEVLRPAMLWNDGRSAEQCRQLAQHVPELEAICGNRAMPGFTAPKLLWVAQHEPEVRAKVSRVLLPKDYVRLRLTGEYASDMSDASGTLWLDVAQRCWSPSMLDACELDASAMPRLCEGSDATGQLLPAIAERFGLPQDLVVAGGGGDNAAGAVGVGVLKAGQAFLSLGTSGVYFTAADSYAPNTAGGVHTMCHALPGRWHQMGVLLSAASCLSWLAGLHGVDEVTLLSEAEGESAGDVMFLPYLSGERTPHDDPQALGVFFGLGHGTTRGQLTLAVLEGVTLAFVDAQQSLLDAGAEPHDVSVIGGGARSELWGRMLASALGRTLVFREGAELGAAFGAAQLARLAVTGESPEAVCTQGAIRAEALPDPALAARSAARLPIFRKLYDRLVDVFPQLRDGDDR